LSRGEFGFRRNLRLYRRKLDALAAVDDRAAGSAIRPVRAMKAAAAPWPRAADFYCYQI
jgi:hypothetical protein